MPPPGRSDKLQPSILDRLIDHNPKGGTRLGEESSLDLKGIKQALRRDLEWLLNSRRPPLPALGRPGPLADSVLGYGLPDISALSLSNPNDRERLRRLLQEAIRRFEPRLEQVNVTLEEGRRDERSLHFRIDGVLDVDPQPEIISFDSAIRLHTKVIEVEGGGQ